MRTMTLFDRPENCSDEHRNAVVDNLSMLMSEKVRIYRTYAISPEYNDGQDFVFVTTHKDTHLNLGRLEHATLRHLGHLLEAEFEDFSGAQIIVYMGAGSDDAWMVTRTTDDIEFDNVTVFTFSPAQGRIS